MRKRTREKIEKAYWLKTEGVIRHVPASALKEQSEKRTYQARIQNQITLKQWQGWLQRSTNQIHF